jgi:heme exporter protein CcmD
MNDYSTYIIASYGIAIVALTLLLLATLRNYFCAKKNLKNEK